MIGETTKAIVLAAGNSSRFKTKTTKQLEPICGRPMIIHTLQALSNLSIPTALVVGNQADQMKDVVAKYGLNVDYITQEKQLGTGHAIKCSELSWDKDDILILSGDVPLLGGKYIEKLIKSHKDSNATISFFVTDVIDPSGYGRVLEKDGGIKIIEDKDCSDEEREISTINSGIYIIKKDFLEKTVNKLQKSKKTGEYYVTDLINIACDENEKVETVFIPYDYVRGVNNLEELWIVEHIMRSDLIKHWMLEGVRFYSPQTVQLDCDVTIGQGSKIGAGVHLLGSTVVGQDCIIGSYSIIKNTKIADNSIVHAHSVISDSELKGGCEVGPFAHLRNNAIIGDDAIIGNFVEVKNSKIGTKSKAKHLSYLGDSTIGSAANIGAGTITCNHDGVNKHKTEIGDGAYIGSNNTLIAPVKVGKKAYTAAGSTINKDVPENALAIARTKQENKKGYADKIRNKAIKKVNNSSAEINKKFRLNFLGAMRANDLSEDIL